MKTRSESLAEAAKVYRGRRSEAGLIVKTTSRDAATTGLELEKRTGLAAAVDPAEVVRIEAIVDAALAQAAEIAKQKWGFDLPIGCRHDWTNRTATAKAPRSKGGKYTHGFLTLDGEALPETGDRKQPGVSLRLAKYAAMGGSSWHEYERFDHSPFIGGRRHIEPDDVFRFLAIHEASHAIEHGLSIETRCALAREWASSGRYIIAARRYYGPTTYAADGSEIRVSAHEAAWQGVYFQLREATGLNALGVPPLGVKPKKHHCQCVVCGKGFEATRADASLCSTKCRVKKHRGRA